jgi:hypothetical protein
MNKQQLIKSWIEALSLYQQNKFHENPSLDSISMFEISSGSVSITIERDLYEVSLKDLAKSQGRTLDYLKIELSNYSDEEAREFFEISFFHQTNIESFFIELTDAVISMKRIFMINQEASLWVEELESKYSKIWKKCPNIQNAPFPSPEDEMPDLNKFSASFIAHYEG